ncbi:adenosine tRNA methylthiotransferase [Buchnera aphidicola (Nipponaphis monzeni)]|uniref:tRNA-2-methylthio-N(6)-dimethylallyladenosine synthase n=1 Tax=Buchnera aphidicola (Nipponaphis monzeni) TaxID=2495405 RepID=A0A455TAF0_9GAMM|nr:tRNA (N6-isopentenyl adenosine(37)-C2)-methylthiotransferase MiaB [Buchnera aphidicola]BBI01337.1 adenosine tRNA methylthiotransferase [Buchnera aphidicola (Nipponaphis monzeni)]
MKKIFIKTWGCQMNEYDSSIVTNTLIKTNKYELTKFSKNADILILNTCSVREKAQEKLFHQLGRWKQLKMHNPNIIIAVGGCVAVQEKGNLYKRAPYIDIIFGTQTLHQLPQLIQQTSKVRKLIVNVQSLGLKKYNDHNHIYKPNVSALIPIIEGCSKYCSFCIVPYTRGKEISRPVKNILSEILFSVQKGVKEIVLLGQNVNAYKIKKKNHINHCSFAKLLKLIANIKGVERIRFITSNPINFSDDIIALYKTNFKLTNSLHLPVQSGSNKILKLMKRGYDIDQYKKIIYKLKKVKPDIHITSDFIVGFPGETESDFQNTLDLIKEIKFDMSFSFLYSARPKTKACKLIDDIPLQTKKNRLYKLQNIITQQTIKWSRRMLGSIQSVLVEGVSKKNILEICGRTENNRTVHFKGNPKLIGTIVKLKITEINYHYIKGVICS